jgi:hypothetical protein
LSLLGERPNARTIFLALLMLCSMLAISADSQVGVACSFVLLVKSSMTVAGDAIHEKTAKRTV